MRTIPRKSLLSSSLVLAMLALGSTAPAQIRKAPSVVVQNGDFLRGTYDDVYVTGGLAILDGATVRGTLYVLGGGTITRTSRGAMIHGAIEASSAGNIDLQATTVLGAVNLQRSGALTVGAGCALAEVWVSESGDVRVEALASTGQLLLDRSGDTAIRGSVESITSSGSGGISLEGARVFPGGIDVLSGTGAVDICGSEIGINSATQQTGSGGVKVSETLGDVLAVGDAGCGSSQINGAVIVQKGTGSVRLVGATLNSDLIVLEQVGDVELDGSGCGPSSPGCAIVSDVRVVKSTGNITLRGITTDSDTTLAWNDGNVTIEASHLGSDAVIDSNWAVVSANSFSLEDVLVTGNAGPVRIDRNCDMRLTVTGNDGVTLTNNNPVDAAAAGAVCASGYGFSDADVSDNTGGVFVGGNKGESLAGVGNAPAPVKGPSGNDILFTDGQFVGF